MIKTLSIFPTRFFVLLVCFGLGFFSLPPNSRQKTTEDRICNINKKKRKKEKRLKFDDVFSSEKKKNMKIE